MNIQDDMYIIHKYEKIDNESFNDSILNPLKKNIDSIINDDRLSISEKKDKIDESFIEAYKDLDNFKYHSNSSSLKKLESDGFKSQLNEYENYIHESFINSLVDQNALKDFNNNVTKQFNNDVHDMIMHTPPKDRDEKLKDLYNIKLKSLQDSNYDDISYEILKHKLDEEFENGKETVKKMEHLGVNPFSLNNG